MPELTGFPMLSQRDGDINQDYNCVPTSIASALSWLTGKSYRGGTIKDLVYGQAYVGGTAASAYVAYCASQGIKLEPINGSGEQLVAALHTEIAAEHPCLITEPDPYSVGWTHVCCAYKCDSGSVTVMDPWISVPVWKSDAQWATQLADNQIWRLEKAMPQPQGWHDDGSTLTAPNGEKVVLGFRSHIMAAPTWDTGNQPQEAEYHADQVLLHNASVGAGQRQCFRDTMLWYTDKQGVVEEPYLGLEIDAAYKRIATLEAQVAQAPKPTVNTSVNVSDAITQIHSIEVAETTALKDLGAS